MGCTMSLRESRDPGNNDPGDETHCTEHKFPIWLRALADFTLDGKYTIIEEKEGSSITPKYRAIDRENGRQVTIKTAVTHSYIGCILNEFLMYKHVDDDTFHGLPKAVQFEWRDSLAVIVTTESGHSLHEIISAGGSLCVNEAMSLGVQVLRILRFLHEKSIVHCRINPQNITCSSLVGSQNSFSVTNFEKALRQDLEQRISRDPVRLDEIGFLSIWQHAGLVSADRRDDLEALGFVLAYSLLGFPFWDTRMAETYNNGYFLHAKRISHLRRMFYRLPTNFMEYFSYVRSIAHGEIPDYAYVERLFLQLAAEAGRSSRRV